MMIKLIEAGLPCSKFLLLTCLNGPFSEETVPYLLETNPDLVHKLTLTDLSRCYTRPSTFEVIVLDDYSKIFRTHADDHLYKETANTLAALTRYIPTLQFEWQDFLASKDPSCLKLIRSGFPCPNCLYMRRCLRPLYAAIIANDTTLATEMIKDGFNAGQP